MGVALYEGVVVPVLSIGAARGDMVVCHATPASSWASSAARCFEPGVFEAHGESPDVVEHAGRRFTALDVAALYAPVERTRARRPWTFYCAPAASLVPGATTVIAGSHASPRNVRHCKA